MKTEVKASELVHVYVPESAVSAIELATELSVSGYSDSQDPLDTGNEITDKQIRILQANTRPLIQGNNNVTSSPNNEFQFNISNLVSDNNSVHQTRPDGDPLALDNDDDVQDNSTRPVNPEKDLLATVNAVGLVDRNESSALQVNLPGDLVHIKTEIIDDIVEEYEPHEYFFKTENDDFGEVNIKNEFDRYMNDESSAHKSYDISHVSQKLNGIEHGTENSDFSTVCNDAESEGTDHGDSNLSIGTCVAKPDNTCRAADLKRPFKCPVCDKRISSRRNLKHHMRTHDTTHAYKCDLCEKGFHQKGNLKTHMLTHEPNPSIRYKFTCDICGKGFSTKANLSSHKVVHEPRSYARYKFFCQVCGRAFTQKSHLRSHLLTHETDPDLKYLFKCSVCEKGFSKKTNLKIHELIHSSVKDPNLKNLYKCNLCEKGFMRKSDYTRHVSRHDLFQCDICKRRFKDKSILEIHIKNHKPSRLLKLHKCEECKMEFRRKGYLLQHNKIHDPEYKRTIQCDMCETSCTGLDEFRAHKLTHRFDPQICKVCNKEFARRWYLKIHALTHESDPNVKYVYWCDVCGRGFTEKHNLKRHVRIHEPRFKCDLCQERFTRNSILKKHIMAHVKALTKTSIRR